MTEFPKDNEIQQGLYYRLKRLIGATGTRLLEKFSPANHQTSSHFADDYTKSRFTKQGIIVVENVLPAAGINLHIKATPTDKDSPQ